MRLKYRALPSQKYLHECLDYNPETGDLTWKTRPIHHFDSIRSMNRTNSAFAGKSAYRTPVRGYYCCTINCVSFKTHRIIWKYMTGEEPILEIDHVNNIKTDNRFSNLREANSNQNKHNIKKPKHNSTGLKGAHRDINTNRFTSSIYLNKIRHFLGYFDTAEEAHKAYCEAANRLHGKFANFG